MDITTAPARQVLADSAQGSDHSSAHDGGVTVVRVSGEVDIYTGPRLRVVLGELLGTCAGSPAGGGQRPVSGVDAGVVVDLSAVTFVDSHALGVLVLAAKRARAAGRGFALVVTSDHILRTFTMMGLAKAIPLMPDVQSAVSSVA